MKTKDGVEKIIFQVILFYFLHSINRGAESVRNYLDDLTNFII